MKHLKRVMYDNDETALCRGAAAMCSGTIHHILGDGELGSEFFREAIAAADGAKEKELQRTIHLYHYGTTKVRDLIREG